MFYRGMFKGNNLGYLFFLMQSVHLGPGCPAAPKPNHLLLKVYDYRQGLGEKFCNMIQNYLSVLHSHSVYLSD